jgi:hypothetical protein
MILQRRLRYFLRCIVVCPHLDCGFPSPWPWRSAGNCAAAVEIASLKSTSVIFSVIGVNAYGYRLHQTNVCVTESLDYLSCLPIEYVHQSIVTSPNDHLAFFPKYHLLRDRHTWNCRCKCSDRLPFALKTIQCKAIYRVIYDKNAALLVYCSVTAGSSQ